MKFAPVALLALAAGVQAGNGFKQAEPAPNEKAMHSSPAMTGTVPLKTGTQGRNSTVAVTSTASCHKCTSTPVAPTSTSGSGSGSGGAGGVGGGSGSGSGGGASNTPASPSSTGFSPSPNPGAKITVPMAGAALGSVAYGLMFLA